MPEIKTFKEALEVARNAGADAANKQMRAAGRESWSEEDLVLATDECMRVLDELGYPAGWNVKKKETG